MIEDKHVNEKSPGSTTYYLRTQEFDRSSGEGTGFLFEPFTAAALREALVTALDTYAEPRRWRRLVRHGMRQDFSWRQQVGEYLELYGRMLAAS